MTITTRIIKEDEKEKFNAFLDTHPKGHVLQTWQWGELKASTGWRPYRIVAEENGQIIAAISVLERPLPKGLGSIFYAPRGPVATPSEPAVLEALLAKIKELAKAKKAVFLKIDPGIPFGDVAWQQALNKHGFKLIDKGEGFEGVQPRYVFRLDIHADLDTLLANCHQKTRYNIRLAEKKGVSIIHEAGREYLPVFYEILQETAKRDKFLVRSYAYYEKFFDELAPAGLTKLFIAMWQGVPIAGTLALKQGEKAWYLYGASSNAHRNVMPNYLIQWEMIKWAKENGCTMYDFRGVPGDVAEDHPLYGLVKFKKGFNGDYVRFIGEYNLVYRPLFYHVYNILEPMYQKAVRRRINKRKARAASAPAKQSEMPEDAAAD